MIGHGSRRTRIHFARNGYPDRQRVHRLDAGTCSGEPRIAGTRIKVRHVYTWVERQGLTVAEVVANYPQLSRSAVHAALAYYWARPGEIHDAIVAEERLVAELKAKAGPSLVAQKRAAGS